MKTHFNFTIGCLLFITFVNAQIINIPDTNFKNILLASSTTLPYAFDGTFPCTYDTTYLKIDANTDGEIQQSEADQVLGLNIGWHNIHNLTGIEHFTNLCSLSVQGNQISEVNLAVLTNLKHLSVSDYPLTTLNLPIGMKGFSVNNCSLSSLDLTLYPELEGVDCRNNSILSLDFSNNPNLTTVYCSHNQLSSLDFSNNPLFNDLGCEYNNLTSLNIQNGAMQQFGPYPTTIYNECWGNNPNLTHICADTNEIVAVNSFLSSCGISQPITVDNSCPLATSEQNKVLVSKISLYPNPNAGFFTMDLSKLEETFVKMQLIDNLSKIVYEKKLDYTKTTTFDISHLATGTYNVQISNATKSIQTKIIKN